MPLHVVAVGEVAVKIGAMEPGFAVEVVEQA